jgi:hypothetical protein
MKHLHVHQTLTVCYTDLSTLLLDIKRVVTTTSPMFNHNLVRLLLTSQSEGAGGATYYDTTQTNVSLRDALP